MPGYPVNSNLEPTTENWRISQHCFSDEIRSQMTLPEKFQLCDITLREGRQLPGVSLRRDEVIRIADALVDAGVSMVQMHHDDPKEMEEVKKRHPDLIVEALVHPTAVLNPELAKVEVDLNVEHGADYTTLCFFLLAEPDVPVRIDGRRPEHHHRTSYRERLRFGGLRAREIRPREESGLPDPGLHAHPHRAAG